MIVGLLLVALVATLDYQVGRIAMHAAPLYVVPAGAALGLWIRRLPRSAEPKGGGPLLPVANIKGATLLFSELRMMASDVCLPLALTNVRFWGQSGQ